MTTSMKTLMRNHPKLVFALYVVVVTLCIDFTMAHVFWRLLAEDRQYFTRGLRCKDPFFHHALERNVDMPWDWGGYYRIVTNSLGFRDFEKREIPLASARKRIVLLGDSFVEGLGLPYEKTFAGIITRSLRDEDVEVLNAGVASYSPRLYYLKTKYLLERQGLKFERLVVFTDISDMQDEIVYRNYVPENRESRRGIEYFLRNYLVRHSVIGNLSGRVIYLLSEGENRPHADREDEAHGVFDTRAPIEPLQYGIWETDAEFYAEQPYWYAPHCYETWGREGSSLARLHMAKLVELCRKHGVAVTLAVYPWPHQLRKYEEGLRHAQFWRRFAAEERVDFIDFFPYFKGDDVEAAVKRYYIPGDVHFSASGSELIARKFLEWHRSQEGS